MIAVSRFCVCLFFFILLSGNACAQEEAPLGLHNADKPKELLEYFSKNSPRDARESFIAGKLFYTRKEWARAQAELQKAAASGDGWRDEALYLLAETYRQLGKKEEAERRLETIAQKPSGGSYYPQALNAHILRRLAGGQAIPTELLVQAAGAAETALSNKGRFLLAASRQEEASKNTADAREYLVRALRLPPAKGWGDAIVDAALAWASRGELGPNDELDLASAMINTQRDRAALAHLAALSKARLDPTNRVRLFDIRCWIERRMSAWDQCARTIAELEQLATDEGLGQGLGENARFTALRLRFLLAQARADFPAMLNSARAMLALNKAEAAAWWRTVITESKDADQRRALELEYLGTWPHDFAIEQKLRDDVVALYMDGRYESAFSMTHKALALIRDRGLRSALLYFRSRQLADTLGSENEASREAAAAVILEAPLTLYHYLLNPIPPNDRLAAEALEENCSWQRMASLSFLASEGLREAIFARFRSGIEALPERELLLLSDTIDFGLLVQILPEPAQAVFEQLVRARLWPEALAEITRRFPAGGQTLSSQEPETLVMLARLAARAARYNTELWCYYRVLTACGWQYNFAAVERACGGTIFSRLYPRHYSAEVGRWAKEYALDPNLVFALMRQESAFARSIGSWAGAQGLMQLMPATARDIARSLGLASYDLFDPDDNIRMGCNMLGWLTKTYPNDPASVLIGYNAGPGNISRWKNAYRARYGKEGALDRFSESVPYKETKEYIRLVLSGYMLYTYVYFRP